MPAACGADVDLSTESESTDLRADAHAGEAGRQSSQTSVCIPDREDSYCGEPSWEEHVALDYHYADRVAFIGDDARARSAAEAIRVALDSLAAVSPTPTPDEVSEVLAPWQGDEQAVQVSDNAVSRSGTAFGVAVDGGCVFGSVSDGEVEVDVGGYINDGGCLAVYAH